MPVTDQASQVTYNGNFSSVVAYPIPFTYFKSSEIYCYVDGVAYTTFSVTPEGVVTSTKVSVNSKITIVRSLAYEQTLDLVEGGDLPADLLEQALDSNVMLSQQLRDLYGSALRVSPGELLNELPAKSELAGKVIIFDSEGEPDSYTMAQLAADIAEELALNDQVSDKVTVTTANASTRALLAPTFTGQVLVQLDDGTLWTGTGLTAGDWQEGSTAAGDQVLVSTDAELAAAINDGATRITPVGTVTLGSTKRTIPDTCMIDPSVDGGYFDLGNRADIMEINGQVTSYGRQLFRNAKPCEGKLPATYLDMASTETWGEGGYYKSSIIAWATATSYTINQLTLQAGVYYRCLTPHTSGTFATDLGAGKWEECLVSDTNNPRYPSVYGSFGGKPVQADLFGTKYNAPDLDGETIMRKLQAAMDCGRKGSTSEGQFDLHLGRMSATMTGPVFKQFKWVRIKGAGRSLTGFTFDHPTSGTIWNGLQASDWPIGFYMNCDPTRVDSSSTSGFQWGIEKMALRVTDTCAKEHVMILAAGEGRIEENSYTRDIIIESWATGAIHYYNTNLHEIEGIEINDVHATTFNASVGIPNRWAVLRGSTLGRLIINRLMVNSGCGRAFTATGGEIHMTNCKFENPNVGIHLTGFANCFVESLWYINNTGQGKIGSGEDCPMTIYIPASEAQVQLNAQHIYFGENGPPAPVLGIVDYDVAAKDPEMYQYAIGDGEVAPTGHVVNADGTGSRSRLILSYDRTRVGQGSAPAAWVTATGYVVGDQVLSGGLDFECVVAHTSAAGDEPAVGTSWPMYWKALPYRGRVMMMSDGTLTGTATQGVSAGTGAGSHIKWNYNRGN